jgi:chromosome partitioning protein
LSTRVIAFVNFKGGVGKTANVVNIGAALAKYHNRKVLIVDLDAQSNASLWLMHPEHWRAWTKDLSRTVYQIFNDHIVGTDLFKFSRAVVRGVPNKNNFPLIANLDLLPSSVQMIAIENKIHQNRFALSYSFLYKTMKPYFEGYDYVFLDCPPNLYTITRNAIFAADYCVIPYIPDFLSLSGFEVLVDEVQDFYDRMSGRLTGRKRPQVAAFIINHFEKKKNVFELGVNELKLAIKQIKPSGKIHPQADILHPYVRFNVHVAESTSEHLPIILHNPQSIGAADYTDLAQNFKIHFEETL